MAKEKYIDAEKLKSEIERLKNHAECSKNEWINEGYNQNAFAEDCRIDSFDKLLSFIDSLQQEQPEVDSEMLNYKKMLELLLESISYAYAKTDGTYGNLSPVVSDKVRYIEKQLRELALKRKWGNSYEIH